MAKGDVEGQKLYLRNKVDENKEEKQLSKVYNTTVITLWNQI